MGGKKLLPLLWHFVVGECWQFCPRLLKPMVFYWNVPGNLQPSLTLSEKSLCFGSIWVSCLGSTMLWSARCEEKPCSLSATKFLPAATQLPLLGNWELNVVMQMEFSVASSFAEQIYSDTSDWNLPRRQQWGIGVGAVQGQGVQTGSGICSVQHGEKQEWGKVAAIKISQNK